MQQVIKWESNVIDLETILKELISKGYKIINVIPTKYSDYHRLINALIVVEEGRKEKLEKLEKI